MKVRNMRWGYDGGGMACGPVDGNWIVEICVTGNDKHNYFVLETRMSEFARIFVSPVPLFDIMIQSNHYDVDSMDEFEKAVTHSIEDYDYEIGDEPEEMEESEFAKAIHLVRVAMQQFYDNEDDEADYYQTAQDFIEPYVDEELEEMELPEIKDEGEDDN